MSRVQGPSRYQGTYRTGSGRRSPTLNPVYRISPGRAAFELVQPAPGRCRLAVGKLGRLDRSSPALEGSSVLARWLLGGNSIVCVVCEVVPAPAHSSSGDNCSGSTSSCGPLGQSSPTAESWLGVVRDDLSVCGPESGAHGDECGHSCRPLLCRRRRLEPHRELSADERSCDAELPNWTVELSQLSDCSSLFIV